MKRPITDWCKWNDSKLRMPKWGSGLGYIHYGHTRNYIRFLMTVPNFYYPKQLDRRPPEIRFKNIDRQQTSEDLGRIDQWCQQAGHLISMQNIQAKTIMKTPINNISATNIFDHFLRTNVQIGVADIFEMEALKYGRDILTLFTTAQIGLRDKFDFMNIVNDLQDKIAIQIHESRSQQSADVYLYYYDKSMPDLYDKSNAELSDSLVGITLINTTYDKTRGTTIVLKEHADAISEVIQKHIKDDDHPCFVLTVSENGIEETRRSIRKSTADICHNEFYPFLGMDVTTYFDNYLASKEGILLLIGPAGTGKSTFIRSLILHSQKAGCMIYDEDTMSSLTTLNHFYSSTHGILAMEDADNLLGKREEGNRHLAGMLNFADGIVNDYSKKMVIATNLSSINKLDPALIRKGRCYDIINFQQLTPPQANAARAAVGLPPRDFDQLVVLADALNEHSAILSNNRQQGIGFAS